MDTIKCEVCGVVFPNRIFKVTNSQDITFENVTTNCPNGHRTRAIADGTYDFDEAGVAKLLRLIPRKDVEQIRIAAFNIHTNGGTADDFQTAVSNINPAYASMFAGMLETLKDKNFQFWMKWLLGAITVFMSGDAIRNVNVNVSVNNVVNSQPEAKSSYSEDYQRELRRRNLEKIKLKADTAPTNKNFKK